MNKPALLAVITPVRLMGGSGDHIDNTLPGDLPGGGEGGPPVPTPPEGAHPSHPIYYPDAEPSHPIVLPEPPDVGDAHPDHTLPGDLPTPTHPIVIPPEVIEAPDAFEMKVGWTESTGWVVVFVPTGEHVTPSRK